MAVWFLGSTAWGAYVWWTRGERPTIRTAIGILVYFAIQVAGQNLLVSRIVRWTISAWLSYLVAAAWSLGSYWLVTFVFYALLDPLGFQGALDDIPASILFEGAFLSPWYAAWWAMLRLGCTSVGAALSAAGVQQILMKWVTLIHFPREGWLWLAPMQFLIGWSLMFVPAGVASHKVMPPTKPTLWGQALAWIVPAAASLVLLLILVKLFSW